MSITFKFYYCGTRNQCDVCGSHTEKFHLGASGDLGDQSIFVCEDCIKNPASLDKALTEHIEGFRRCAEWRVSFIESLRGKLDGLPSKTDWEKEMADIDRYWEEEDQKQKARGEIDKVNKAAQDSDLPF